MRIRPAKGIYIRVALILFLIIATAIIQYSLHHSEGFLVFYIRHLFTPIQQFKSFTFNRVNYSFGDILYLLLALLWLLITIRCVYFLVTFRKNSYDLKVELLRFITLPAILYFLFLISWGGNYERRPLSAGWETDSINWDKSALIAMNVELVQKLNAERLKPIVFQHLPGTNTTANWLFHQKYGDRLAQLEVKPTSLGYMLNYMGIQGYYNPFTGEAQFNRFIPPFMHPFVVSHEMAHQAGIAAEDDANLLAYVLGSESNVPAFRYSAYFNLFVYAYLDLKMEDSTTAHHIYANLNQQSKNDMDTLREMNRRYRSSFRKISSDMYDGYLRWHGQKDGINTYSEVTKWVYMREKCPQKKADLEVCP